ncbi:MAG: hypothetical protein IJR27_01280 [Synergistaceae bacterium]|nr:hypothetical protein [Synergistaceae bacterium]
MAILTDAARIVLVQYILTRPIHLAIGEGSEEWYNNSGGVPDPPEYDATELVHELGRKKLTQSFFVLEDDDGDIDMPGGRKYKQSAEPTRNIYLNFAFNYGEGIEKIIREVGVFIDTQTNSELPANQTYFQPEDITHKGTLIMLEHLDDPDKFTPNKKGSYGTVLTI